MGNEEKDIMVYCPRCGWITSKHDAKYCRCNKEKLIKKIEIDSGKSKELYQKYHEIFDLQKVQFPAEHGKNWYVYCKPFVDEVIRKNPEFSESAYKHRWIHILKTERIQIIKHERIKYEERLYGENYYSTRQAQSFYGQCCPYCGAIELKKISFETRIKAYLDMGVDNSLRGRTHQCEFCGLVFKLIPRSLNPDCLGFYMDLIQEYYDNDDDFSSDPYATHSPDYPITFSQCRLPKDKQL